MAPLTTPSVSVGAVTADTAAQVATAAFVVGGGAGHPHRPVAHHHG